MKKILIIEDDKIMRENTAEILELAGYEVFVAPNGKLGAAMAVEKTPDLIVCDIMMPELDGYGVLNKVSQDPKTMGIPFIFLTAKAEKSEMRRGMELGADDYLTKPFEDSELLAAIESRLKKVERLNLEFSRDFQGLNTFLDEASSLKELKSLSKNRPPQKFKKKELIFSSGDLPQFAYFLTKGSVKTMLANDDGKELITNVHKAGEFFGHTALFERKPHSDSAIVMEECEIVKIPKEDFLALISRNREVAAQFIRILSNQIDEQEKQLVRLAYDSVRKRTAEALIQLAGKNKSVRVTREDLASMAGTATETVIRCLTDFKHDGLIEVSGREITIIDQSGLAKIP